MNPLYRNDTPGTYPPSWYAATADIPPPRAPLDGDIRADVAIVGAGYTGLSTALHLARGGLDVVVIDAHRAGFGASGRNGGQVGTGWNKDQHWLERRVGREDARKLWDLTVEAKRLTREMVEDVAPDASFKPGVFRGEWTLAGAEEARAYGDWLAQNYGYETEYLDQTAAQDLVRSPVYKGGLLDWDAGHLHPLRYAMGLARGVEAAGGRIFEMTEASGVSKGEVRTNRGTIRAEHVVVAGNGYLSNILGRINARVMPINSFIAATAPLGNRAGDILTQDVAVADDKFVVNYFRLSEDKRLLFGGRENYGIGFPTDILTALRQRMLRLFPQLGDIAVDYHWGGTLGITMHRLPVIEEVEPGVLAAGGFSGHGVALTGLAGKIMAEAIMGDKARLALTQRLPVVPFPGGTTLRAPLLTLAMTWYSLRDRLGV